ncbi:DinB family protein [Chungangia koreensis]|uniref:DinB family protein n=1 Tax=Chungangia koreensis TaxID=752657 RepID=A0ABV8X3Q8_9LACT
MKLIEDLTAVRLELVDLLTPLSHEQLNVKINDGTWSIVQVVRHLVFIDELIYPSLLKAMQRESNVVEEKNIDFVRDRTQKLKSPYPEPSEDFIEKGNLINLLQTVRQPLLNYLKTVEEKELIEKTMLHPLLGPMQTKQLLEFVVLHEKRHIEQIQELIGSSNLASY